MPMDSEKPNSIGSIATRIACTLVGVLLLYALSIGPAIYFLAWSKTGRPLLQEFYRPLWDASEKTPLFPALFAYWEWWAELKGCSGTQPFPPWYWRSYPPPHFPTHGDPP